MTVLLSWVLAAGLMAQAPALRTATAAPAAASVSGRVTDAATGRPLRMVRVTLTPAVRGRDSAERYTRTDPAGVFQFADVPAGRVHVTASKARYVTLQYQQQLPEASGKPLEIVGGRAFERIDIALPRAAAIVGHVLDDLGEPVNGAHVTAIKRGYNERGHAFVDVAGGVTNDIGEYRISQLARGEYYVVAAERSDGFGSEMDADVGFLRTAFPATADMAEARAVAVRAGQDTVGIDIMLQPARTARVKGLVLSEDGRPAPNAWVVLQAVGGSVGAGIGADTRAGADGTFLLPRVVPGRYDLHVRVNTKPPEGTILPLDVNGEDLNALVVPLTRGGRLMGRVVPPEGVAGKRAVEVRISALPIADTLVFGTGFGGAVNDDWTFDWDFLLGKRIIRPGSLPPGWILKAVMRGEDDITDTPIVFQGAQVVRDVEIILATDGATVEGIAIAGDKPVERYTVIAFPEDDTQWASWSRFIKVARPDQSGRFKLDDLPPRAYRIAAVEQVEENQWYDRDFLEELLGTAQRVTLTGSQRVSLQLPLVRSAK